MKLFNTCALCATLAVPALVQTVQAKDSVAVQIIQTTMQGMDAFAKVIIAVDEEKVSPKDAAALIDELNEAMSEVEAAIPKLSDEEKEELGKLMADKEVAASIEEASKTLLELFEALEEVNYGGSKELKVSCTKFAKLYDVEL